MAVRYQVGVLFVHGMGEQSRGDTIGQMGEAFADWLRREDEGRHTRLKGPKPVTYKPTIRRALLKDTRADVSEGASLIISFDEQLTEAEEKAGVAKEPVANWLLSESWWAGSFRPASYRQTALWAIGVGPWVIASQLDAAARRTAKQNAPRWLVILAKVFLYVAAGLAAALITPLALLLMIVGLLPIPGLRDFIVGAQRNLSGSYGDLSILVRSPVGFAAMWSTVEGDIKRLSEHCDQVVIVAHSQGSAISWMALRRWADRILAANQGMPELGEIPQDPSDGTKATVDAAAATESPTSQDQDVKPQPVAIFVSFGQALRKLKMLYLIHATGSFRQRAEFVALSIVSTAALVVVAITVSTGLWELATSSVVAFKAPWEERRLQALSAAILLIIGVQLRLSRLSRKWVQESEDQLSIEVARVSAAMPEWKWIDLWGSADPAANGPLFDVLPEIVTSFKVRNLGSTVLDHITYWSNTTEFVSEIVGLANSVSNPKPLTPRTPQQKRSTVQVRHRRVEMLVVARVVFFASLAAGALVINGKAIGGWLLDRVGSLIGAEWFWSEAHVLGYGAFLAAGLLVWVGMLMWFNGIVSADATAYFRDGAPRTDSGRVVFWWVTVGGLLMTTAPLTIVAGEYWVAALYAVTVGLGVAVVLKVLTGDETTLASSLPAEELGAALEHVGGR